MGSSTGTLLVNERGALERIFNGTGGLIAVHAEDEKRMDERAVMIEGRTDMAAHAEWRDDVMALIATQLAVELAQASGHRLHVLHLTSGIEADWLEGITVLPSSAAGEGAIITTETLPQHLTFDETDVEREGARLKMNPPIRYAKDRATLWKQLKQGTVQCIATDHAPHTLEAKALGFPAAPSGMPGVETSLAVMLTHAKDGTCSIEDVVKWMSTNVADCFNMVGKGRLEEGMDGDVILVDMDQRHAVADEHTWTRVGWSPFNGRELVGWTQVTVVAGTPVFERSPETGPKGRLLVEPGSVGSPGHDAVVLELVEFAVFSFNVAQERFRTGRRTRSVLDELSRRDLAAPLVDSGAQPSQHRLPVAGSDQLVDVAKVCRHCLEELSSVQVSERVGWEITERAHRPVNVLQAPQPVLGNINVEPRFEHGVPSRWKVVNSEIAVEQLLLNFIAEHHM